MCMGDLNGHIDGFDGVHGVHGAGQRNLEGKCYLLFYLFFYQEKESCVSNT